MNKSILIITILVSFLLSQVQAYALKTQQWETSYGAKVVFYETNAVPILDIYVAFAAGSAYDEKLYGLSTLTTNMLNQGNGALDASQVAENLDQTGAQYTAETNRDLALLHLKTLTSKEALAQATETFALILNKPQFRSDAFYRTKNQLLALISHKEESPDELANLTFFNALYGNQPYAHSVNGTKETVKNIQSWQVRNFYKRYFVGRNATLVMVGAITEDQAKQIAETLLAKLPEGTKAQPIPVATPLLNPKKIALPYTSTQTVIRIGQLGMTYQNPNYFPLVIANYILGGGFMVSQLALEIREKQGLSYNAESQLIPMLAGGPFIIGMSTKNNQAPLALQITERTLDAFLKTGPTEKELLVAKEYLSGSFSLSLASNNSIAKMLLGIAFYNLPDNYLDSYVTHLKNVKAEEVKTAFAAFIHPDELLQVTVGPS